MSSTPSTASATDVALLVGGGIGSELVPPVLQLLERAAAAITWHRIDVPTINPTTTNDHLDEAVAAVERYGVALKTKFLTPPPSPQKRDFVRPGNPNVELRQRLGLFIGVRPLRTYPGLPTRYPGLDLLFIRESSEDIYKGIEHEIVPGVVQSLKVVTRTACERIARYAFEITEELGRSKLHFIHKGNIMKRSDGLFLEIVRSVAAKHPAVEFRDVIVDAACMQLVLDPYQFDVLLSGNLYGDILSNLATGLAGGISASAGINRGERLYVFEAIHGDAPQLVGTGTANPLPLVMPAIELLRQIEQQDVAARLERAVATVLASERNRTPDLGGEASTAQVCAAIADALI